VVQEFNKGVYDYIIATDEGRNRHDDKESGDSGTESEEGDEEGCVSLCISMLLRAKDPKVRRARVCMTVAGLVLQGITGG